VKNVAIRDLLVIGAPVEIERKHIVDALNAHREPLKPVGELTGNGCTFKPATCWSK
jgi:hypothetical protein